MKITRALVILVLILVLAGCSYHGPKTDPEQGTTLVDTYWKLTAADGVEFTTPAGQQEVHIILRPDYRVTGFGGCNNFSGSWVMEEDQLVVGPLISTMMACPDMDNERTLLAALDGRVVAEISGEVLTVTGRDGVELVFQAVYSQ